ncbi:hypothetical protein LZ575_17140 [Antarcticibacterium sp. 1MA-6-2]|uniref:hypothetical protein n=1 Tax=Antarcticibacterium sp. 1MA-6-2 TaxID=2908210 RepID=UPI001F1E9F9E|nr:hypothetical protein [Antarcticibacterium sp. 1MA-6-2]UJH90512.1 hypothetical protein LZ575_17140 [Antarcticibacterium sp. 1MA-6-2]
MHNLPIIGEDLYGSGTPLPSFKGLYLAAIGLKFSHPISGVPLSLNLPLPKKFRAFSL